MKRFRFPLLLLITCIIAYLPVSSFLFALKNDAFVYNFPNKHFFSEAIRHGYLPTWNPYLNFGFPLYADPGFAWWQPITWVFGVIGYNPYSFTIEVLVYIYISGISMYWLARNLGMEKITAFIIGCMFMCSGFFIGNLQHINFITCAAFLPLVVGTWLNLQNNHSLKNVLLAAFAIYLLFTGGHPAIPIATIYFMLAIGISYGICFRNKINFTSFFKWNIGYLLFAIIFLAPALYSWFSIMPYYSRSEPVSQAQNVFVGFTIPAYISFLFPFSTIRNYDWFMTDVSMRNAYFSIAGFLFFVVFLIRKQKQKLQVIFFTAGLLMLFLSMGGQIKKIVYDNLPGLAWIRINGEFRVFVIFCFLLCGSFELEKFLKSENQSVLYFKNLLKALLALSLLAIIILLIFTNQIYTFPSGEQTITGQIKDFIDQISFGQSILLSLIITCAFSVAYFALSFKIAIKVFISLIVIDLIASCWLLLPITGVGKTSVARMQEVINKSPKGFPPPLLIKEGAKITVSPEEQKLIANWSWYDKKIMHPWIDYPSQLKTTANFYQSKDTALISNKPFIFLKLQPADSLHLIHFTPTSFTIKLSVPAQDTLIVFQNYFPGWQAEINNKLVPIHKFAGTFISIPIDKSSQTVSFRFSIF
ncbi:MAG: YfhO family protein [Bacteroidota bacterium]|nr:YfhO family protein [Bacteroidota bacterium]